MSVEKTLSERGERYGDFTIHARICQKIKEAMAGDKCRRWENLSDVQKQALEVIADKMARIISGDPNYVDNWHDIQGYARLVEERISPDISTSTAIDALGKYVGYGPATPSSYCQKCHSVPCNCAGIKWP